MIVRVSARLPRRAEKKITAALFAAGVMSVERSLTADGAQLCALADESCRDAVLAVLAPYDPSYEPVEERDWQNEWIASFEGGPIAPGVTVVPLGKKPPAEGISIIIDPRDAFGAGTHPTTRLCARLLLDAAGMFSPRSFLDIGTGTGILAILASRLGAARVEGYDIDGAAVVRAQENVRANGCSGVKLFESSIHAAEEPFDLVCANVNSAVIESYFEEIIASVAPGGALILSGIGAEWQSDLERLFSAHALVVVSASEEEGWLGYLLRRKNAGGGPLPRN